MRFTRRGVLIGVGVTGGLVAAWTLGPRRFAPPLPAGEGEYAFDAWLKIAHDGVVSVAVPDLEMGQGVTTLIAQIIAYELGADWRQVAVEPAPVSGAYGNAPLAAEWSPLWMPLASGLAGEPDGLLARRFARNAVFTVTAEGTSLAAHEGAARAAAASARAMLAQAAARRWDVPWEECDAQAGFIVHDKQRLSFAELVAEAVDFTPPDPPVLRAEPPQERAADFPPGAPLRAPRLDLPSKVDGSHMFAGDVRLPDMAYAAIRHAPVGESRLAGFNRDAAKGVPGLLRLVAGSDWLAAVASDWWSAERALKAAAPAFRTRGQADSGTIAERLEKALQSGDASRIAEAGDPDAWLSARPEHSVRYAVAPALHGSLETATATARVGEGKVEIWAASQAPQAARRAVAAVLGRPLEDIVLYPMPAGGSFDARLDAAHLAEAALIAREAGRPVQLIWSRWQEHVAAAPRAPATAVMAAQMTGGGQVTAWKARIAVPATAREFGQRLFDDRTHAAALRETAETFDPLAIEGAVPPYAITHMAIEHVPVSTGLPSGRLRGNAHGMTAFFTESFIDELAHRAEREPLAFRMAMLGGDPRLAECLQRVAALGTWNGGNDGSGQGLACHRIGEGRIAVIALARRDENGVRVDKISAVADIGRIPNVDIARQQIEGGLVYGIGLALGSSTDYADGLPVTGQLRGLDLPPLADCPTIDVAFIDSKAEPADPGELGVAVAAPAIANALFSATGLRFRRLPLLSEEL